MSRRRAFGGSEDGAGMDAIYQGGPNTFWVFIVLTVVLGGAAAWSTGRAVAQTWKPYWQLVWYSVLLAAAVRFFHYALFQEPLIAPGNYAVDLAVLMGLAAAGHKTTRLRQMASQYHWMEADPPSA